MIDINNIILGTGSHYNVKSGNRVSITGDGGNAWGYFGSAYKKLAPRLITYTSYVYGLKDVDVIQIEINGKYRDYNNLDELEKLIKCFENFIKQYKEYINR